MTEEEAWALAEDRNLKLGASGQTGRFIVAVQETDGTWDVRAMEGDPPRSRWKSFSEWVRSWTSLTEPLPSDRDPQTAEDAVHRLGARRGRERATAARDLARLYPDEARGPLEDLLADEDWHVRSVAVRCLGRVAGRDGWMTYASLLADGNATAASSAWRTMRALAGPGDIAEILGFAETAHPAIRSSMRAWAIAHDTRR